MRLDYDVEVNVTRFDVDGSGHAVLDARWVVYRDVGGELVRSARSTLVEPAPTNDEAGAVQALSRTLGAMSREIADTIAAATAKQKPAAGSRSASPPRTSAR